MLGKKLLTVAFVLGILACGACGLAFRESPPPPMQLFVGVRTVRVEVSNKTPTHHFDPVALQAAVIRDLNQARKRTALQAVAAGDADSTLTLTVVDEDEYQADTQGNRVVSGVNPAWWQFRAVMSVQLTAKDGRQLWADPAWKVFCRQSVAQMQRRNLNAGWEDAEFRQAFFSNWFVNGQAGLLVYEILHK
jgi:hypothetical protein